MIYGEMRGITLTTIVNNFDKFYFELLKTHCNWDNRRSSYVMLYFSSTIEVSF